MVQRWMVYPVRILMVEDNLGDAGLVEELLKEESPDEFRFDWVGNLERALKRLHEERFDLILVDLSLPDSNGIETVISIHEVAPKTPMVVMTGSQDETLYLEALSRGAQDFISKDRMEGRLLAPMLRYAIVRKQAQEALRTSEMQHALASEFAADPMLVLDADRNISFVNPAVEKIFGYTKAELLGQSLASLAPSLKERDFLEAFFTQAPASAPGLDRKTFELTAKHRDGRELLVEISVGVCDQNNDHKLILVMRDLSRRMETEMALRKSDERCTLFAKGTNDGLWDWDLLEHKMFFSSRWASLAGCDGESPGDTPAAWFERVHPQDLPRLKASLEAHLQGKLPVFESEFRLMRKNGTCSWMFSRGLAVRDSEGKARRIAGSMSNISSRKIAEETIWFDSYHDALTGLPNRSMFLNLLQASIESARGRTDAAFAVFFLDLDSFKVVNDSMGHLMGDQLLIEVAQRIKRCLGPSDTAARLGGDEFALLLPELKDATEAARKSDRIQKELGTRIHLCDTDIFSTASIGIALGPGSYEKAGDILRDADTAMYRAKATGKACAKFFNPSMRNSAVRRFQLVNDLRLAIERREFQVYYQPIVSLDSGRLTGFEALLRWQHPHRGQLLPKEFMPIAEETGLMVPIGLRVLREACQQAQAWYEQFPDDRPLFVSVNLSNKMVSEPDLVRQIQSVLDDTGLDKSCLRLELTENVVMEREDIFTGLCCQLKKMELQLDIDDFGTGYSSLSALHRVPFDTLKIDRSFIAQLDVCGADLEIVRTILALARSLGRQVIAEGVENEQQLVQLRSLKCGRAQGHYFSRPLDHVAAGKLIQARQTW